jgi:hypothetical protein
MTFNISLLIGFAGLFLTAYSIYLVLKKKKYPGKLTLVKENTVGLFDELANNFEEISIQYENAPIKKNIIYIKGSVVNSGEIDLNLNSSETPVKLDLNKNLNWIKANITKSSDNVKSNIEISSDNELIFNCGILRINEFFQFEALIETNDDKSHSTNIFEKIKPSHRLINTQKIQTTRYLNKREREHKEFNFKHFAVLFSVVLAVTFATIVYSTYVTEKADIQYVKSGVIYEANAHSNGYITIENVKTGNETKIKLEKFNENYRVHISAKSFWQKIKSSFWGILIFTGIYIVGSMVDSLNSRKSKQVSRLIE